MHTPFLAVTDLNTERPLKKSAAEVFDELLYAKSKDLGYKGFTKAEVNKIVSETGRNVAHLAKAVAGVMSDRESSFATDTSGPAYTLPANAAPLAASGATLTPPPGVGPTFAPSAPQSFVGSMDAVRAQRPVGQFEDAGGIVTFNLEAGSGASTVQLDCRAIAAQVGLGVSEQAVASVVAAVTKAISAKRKA